MGIQSFNQGQEKPINIDFPEENEYDTSILEKDIKVFQQEIDLKKQELTELENIRNQISERDEEMRERYDMRIDKIKIRIHQLENLIKSDEQSILEINLARNKKSSELFGGQDNKPEILQ